MTEMDVSLTDYALAAECLWFAAFLGRSGSSLPLSKTFLIFFLSTALAAVAGGTVHGFFLNEDSPGHRILWPFTLLCVGITALAGLQVGTALLLSAAAAHPILITGDAAFLVYAVVVLFFRRDFVIAIVAYLPSLIFMAAAFLLAYTRSHDLALLVGFSGVGIMMLAAALQQAKWGLHPRRFNHNAVYHVLQALALWMIFVAAKGSIQLQEHTR